MIDRRGFLGQIPLIETAAARLLGPARPEKTTKILVTGGHPGDPEYGCGGTVARLTDAGHEVVLVYLNDGVPAGKSKNGVRVAEAHKACEILKARPLFAGQIDGDSVVDRAHADRFYALIEPEMPDLILTHWPIDNHADHRAISLLVYETWLRLKRKFVLSYYEVSSGEDTVQFGPTHYVDITSTAERKKSACFAHASQSPQKYYTLQDQICRMRGVEKSCPQAEAFVRHVQSPDLVLPLGF